VQCAEYPQASNGISAANVGNRNKGKTLTFAGALRSYLFLARGS
jgi:hypothetical protein